MQRIFDNIVLPFVLGMWEFRSSVTTSYYPGDWDETEMNDPFFDEAIEDDEARQEVYDRGRDFAHRMTFRLFDV